MGLDGAAESWRGVLGKDEFGNDRIPTITLAIAVPSIGGFLLAALLGLLVERGGDHPGRPYTWSNVMRRVGFDEPN